MFALCVWCRLRTDLLPVDPTCASVAVCTSLAYTCFVCGRKDLVIQSLFASESLVFCSGEVSFFFFSISIFVSVVSFESCFSCEFT